VDRLLSVACFVGLALGLGVASGQVVSDPGDIGPLQVSSVSLTLFDSASGQTLPIDIYFPSQNGEVDPAHSPYATIVFARGFLSSPGNYTENGKHLASWGYIVALPDFPSEDTEARAADVLYVISYLEAQNLSIGSRFHTRIDTGRIGMLGHSLGGLTALMVAGRDARVKAAVALDPVNPPALANTPWDYRLEGPNIDTATAIVGAPSQVCNNLAGYEEIYPYLGADHKALWVLANGSHCDFVGAPDPLQRSACYSLCGGAYDSSRIRIGERYTTAWFNYYLRGQTEYYSYLFGAPAQADVAAGRVTNQVDTGPRNVAAEGQQGAIALTWNMSSNPLIAGYNVYRASSGGDYPTSPTYRTGRTPGFRDEGVAPLQEYYYWVASRDSAGNEHQPSAAVLAVASEPAPGTPTPTVTPSPAPSFTVSPASTLRALWLPMLLDTAGHAPGPRPHTRHACTSGFVR
jgi:hypothetical protein